MVTDAFLALCQYCSLTSHLAQSANDLFISIHKTVERVWNVDFPTKLLYKFLSPSKIMSRNARVKMVDSLELKTPMEEVQPLGAVDVHCRPQHLLRE